MGWYRAGWYAAGWDGTGRDGMGRGGMGWVCSSGFHSLLYGHYLPAVVRDLEVVERKVLVGDEHLEAHVIDRHELEGRQQSRLKDTTLSSR